MKKLIISFLFILILLFSCSLIESNTSKVKLFCSIENRAISDRTIETATLTVSGSDINTLNQTFSGNSVSVLVKNGNDRTFELSVTFDDGDEYTGSTTKDILPGNVNDISITLFKIESDTTDDTEITISFSTALKQNTITIPTYSAKEISIDNDNLFLANWDSIEDESDSGVQIYDIVNRNTPSYLNTAKLWLDAVSVDYSNNYLYVANGGYNMRIFDLSNISSPQILVNDVTQDFATDAKTIKTLIDGNYNYTLSYGVGVDGIGANLFKFDVTTPTSPSRVLSYSIGESNPKALYVEGNYAYVVGEDLNVFDISTQLLERISWTESVITYGEYAYDVVKKGNNLFILGDSELVVIDVTDPTNPEQIFSYAIAGNVINDGCPSPGKALSLYENDLFIADGNDGVVILDISNPVSIVHNFTIPPETGFYFRDVYYYDSHLYIIAEDSPNSGSYLLTYQLE